MTKIRLLLVKTQHFSFCFFSFLVFHLSNGKIISFAHPIFGFWFLVTFGNEVSKILRNLCLHFASDQNTKRRKYGMNETLLFMKNT